MNTRKPSRLSMHDVRLLSEVAHAAENSKRPFTAFVSLHFGLLTLAPKDPATYLRRHVISRLGVWFHRRDVVWTALWIRENFAGPGREHVHLLVHVPSKNWGEFRTAVHRWWPEPGAVDVRRIYDEQRLVRYLSKQLSPQAHFAFRGLIRRQRQCPYTGALTAPVLGRPYGMTNNLKARIKGSSAG